MNSQQKGCLQIAALLILAATLYVPWTQSYDATRVDGLKIGPRAGAHSWIFTPPGVPRWAWERDAPLLKIDVFWNEAVDVPRLVIEWAAVLLIAGLLVWSFRKT
jgi:hypothetical protein